MTNSESTLLITKDSWKNAAKTTLKSNQTITSISQLIQWKEKIPDANYRYRFLETCLNKLQHSDDDELLARHDECQNSFIYNMKFVKSI